MEFNNGFESTVPLNLAADEVGEAMSLQDAFVVPLSRQLFNSETALVWFYFLSRAAQLCAENDSPLSPQLAVFNYETALSNYASVYDIAIKKNVLDHYEESDSDESDSDEADEETEDDTNEEIEVTVDDN